MVAGKRQAEYDEMGDDATDTRAALGEYSGSYLAYLRSVTSGVLLVAYCLWAFEKAELAHHAVPWFQLSIVWFVLAVFRYALLIDAGRAAPPESHPTTAALLFGAICCHFAVGSTQLTSLATARPQGDGRLERPPRCGPGRSRRRAGQSSLQPHCRRARRWSRTHLLAYTVSRTTAPSSVSVTCQHEAPSILSTGARGASGRDDISRSRFVQRARSRAPPTAVNATSCHLGTAALSSLEDQAARFGCAYERLYATQHRPSDTTAGRFTWSRGTGPPAPRHVQSDRLADTQHSSS